MKIYIDEVEFKLLLNVLIMLPKLLFDTAREELFWWLKFYKYEFSAGDWQKERDEGMEEYSRRMRNHRQ